MIPMTTNSSINVNPRFTIEPLSIILVTIMNLRLCGLLGILITSIAAAAQPEIRPLWPNLDKSLLARETAKDRGSTTQPNRFISDIAYPQLIIALPPADKATHTAILVCPGGGYSGVAIDKEGYEVAAWLNSIGHAAVILKYRMPRVELTKNDKPLPLVDGQRAIRWIRANAHELNIDPHKVGIMGFSAGGHLASTVATHFDPPDPSAADPIDRFSDRPDFAVLVYPVITMNEGIAHTGSRKNLLGPDPDPAIVEQYSNELHVMPNTPPTFLVHARDDHVSCQNSILFHDALLANKVPTELHLFDKGGHGFGLGSGKPEPSTWPSLCAHWIAQLLKK